VVQIVSGHHRKRAALVAGLVEIPVIVDTLAMSPEEVRTKQIAHNELVGRSDAEILKGMIGEIESPDLLLATGVDDEQLPVPQTTSTDLLGAPAVNFEWRTISFVFLPHQLAEFEDLIETGLSGRQDLVGVAPLENFEDFARSVSKYQRIKSVHSIGTIIGDLTAAAKRIIADEDGGDEEPEEWVPLRQVIGTARVPAEVAELIGQLIERLEKRGDVSENARWRALELACAELLAAP